MFFLPFRSGRNRPFENQHSDSLVVVNLHYGTFAAPTGPPYTVDMTTSHATDYWNAFQPVGQPTGMVNRIEDPMNPSIFWSNPTLWNSKISDVKAIPSRVNMDINYTYDAVANQFDISVSNQILQNLNGDHNIVYYILEDSILSVQSSPNGVLVDPFIHNDILRDAPTTSWGELLFSGSANAGTTLVHTLQYTPIGTINDLTNCSIVAYIRNNSTEEVIQVAKTYFDNTLTTQELDNIQLNVHPNPTADFIHFSYDASITLSSVQVIDAQGRTVTTHPIHTTGKGTLDVSVLSAGIYLIQFYDGASKLVTRRFQKQ